MANEERFQIRTGMPVVNREGRELGSIDTILAEDESGLSRFIVVEGRLLPIETVLGLEGERLRVGIPEEHLARFPERPASGIPSDEIQQRAYAAWDQIGA